MLRITAYLSAIVASFGINSRISSPGTFVRIGSNSPRTSTGALGFMSNMSMCGGLCDPSKLNLYRAIKLNEHVNIAQVSAHRRTSHGHESAFSRARFARRPR